MQIKKKTASSASTLKAEAAVYAYQINNIVPQNEGAVKPAFDPEAFIKTLKGVDPGCYYLKREEMDSFEIFRGKDFCMAVLLAFRWGFVRGQRAESNRFKRVRAKKAVVA